MVEKMKVYIVGTGMEGRKTLTAEAKTIIENAEVLIGARRMVEPYMGMNKQFFVSWKSEEIAEYLCKKSAGSLFARNLTSGSSKVTYFLSIPSFSSSAASLCSNVVLPTCLGPVKSRTGNILETCLMVPSAALFIYVMANSLQYYYAQITEKYPAILKCHFIIDGDIGIVKSIPISKL